MDGLRLPAHQAVDAQWIVKGHWDQNPEAFKASVPPLLAGRAFNLDGDLARSCAAATLAVAVLDRTSQAHTAGVSAMLIQAEAIASCLLDGHQANALGLARAESGQPSTTASRRVTAAAGSLAAHLENSRKAVSLGAIAAAHTRPRRMASGAITSKQFRAEQTWLGGSDLWPSGADYVPPPAHMVPQLMTDLVEFCGRDDLDPVAQAAIAYAQVMSVQPFTSDNARVARALINGVLRRRGVTTKVVVPLSASFGGHSKRIEAAWLAYRHGDLEAIVTLVAHHVERAAGRSASHIEAFSALERRWRERARPRARSAADRLLPHLVTTPVVNAGEVRRLTGASQASAYEAIARLAEADVLTRISPTRRETMWAALDVFTAASSLVDDLQPQRPIKARSPRQRAARRAGA